MLAFCLLGLVTLAAIGGTAYMVYQTPTRRALRNQARDRKRNRERAKQLGID